MHKPADEIREQLADRFQKGLETTVALLASRGIPKREIESTLTSVARAAFMTGLDLGYDMAANVFGAD